MARLYLKRCKYRHLHEAGLRCQTGHERNTYEREGCAQECQQDKICMGQLEEGQLEEGCEISNGPEAGTR